MSKLLYPFGTINYAGRNDADNEIDTALVVANEDGSILERSEWIIQTLAGGGGRLRIQQSMSTTAEDKAVLMFSVSLWDFNTGAVPEANINIAAITQTMKRSRGGGAFTAVTAPTFTKDDGRVYCAYEFLDAEWEVGDTYKLTLTGITCDIGGDTVYVPAMIWSNLVVEQVDLHAELAKVPKSDDSVTWNATALASINEEVDKALDTIVPDTPTAGSLNDILSKAAPGNTFDKATDSLEAISDKVTAVNEDIGDPSVRTNLQSLEAMLGNPDVAGSTIYETQVVPAADTADDVLVRDVIGKKSDTTAGDSLVALNKINKAAIDAIPAATGVGTLQIATTTIDLDQIAGSYDLFVGTDQAVILEKISFAMPNRDASGDTTLTHITIQTDHETPQVIFNQTTGDVANLTAEAQFGWTGSVYIPVGKKVQLTIGGGAADFTTVCNVIAQYRAVVAGGTLA